MVAVTWRYGGATWRHVASHGVTWRYVALHGVTKRYSYFPSEDEVLISAQARFTVSSAPYLAADGYTYVDMVETHGTLFIS